jgi:predicted nucleic acid-binding protein
MKKRVAIDTNILVFAVDDKSPYFDFCRQLLVDGFNKKFDLFIADKTFYEFYAVLTNIFYKGQECEAVKIWDFYISNPNFTLLHGTSKTPLIVSELMKQKNVTGKYIHDIVLLAIFLENGIDCIYTDNVNDFEGFGIEVIKPEKG